MPLKFDIQNENFDYYFLEQASLMSEAQKELLPKELLYKIYYKGFRLDTRKSAKLSFLQKLYILAKVLNRRFVIVMEDAKNGMNEEDFFKYKKLTENGDIANELSDAGTFVLSNTEVINTFDKLNIANTKGAYHFLMKLKTKRKVPPDEFKRTMNYLSRFINGYESQRKRITMQTGLTMAEWITLTFLYDGEQKVCSVLYKDKFKYSYNSSASKMKTAFGSLQRKGFIIKHGIKASSKFEITTLGKSKVNAIMEKYVVNC